VHQHAASLDPALTAALDGFRQRHGHANVPSKFVVPELEERSGDGPPPAPALPAPPDWPRITRGFALGAGVAELRRQRRRGRLSADLADALTARHGFVWDAAEWRWSCVLGALRAYKEAHGGDVAVPQAFVVPAHSPPWPQATWGLRLGSRVDNIRSQGAYVKHRPERRAELDALGFVWNDLERRWEEVRAALLAYKELHGDLEVPQDFTVPEEAPPPWPQEARGLKLGSRVNRIRCEGLCVKGHPERRAELDALGFVWKLDPLDIRWRGHGRRSVSAAEVEAAPRGVTRVRGALKVVSRRTADAARREEE
jgi:hypothetical protein